MVSEWLADAVKKSSQPRQCQVACLILFGRQKNHSVSFHQNGGKTGEELKSAGK